MTLDDLLKLAQKPRRVIPFNVGTLSGFVRGLNAGEVEESARIADELELTNNRRVLIAMAVCEEDGTPLCGEPENYVERFAGLPEGVVRAIVAKIEDASSLKASEMEELVGNSGGRTASSATVSPAA